MTKETVLVIEDEPDIVELIRYWLEREGYLVMTASDGEQGLAEALERKPDLIVLDLMLPGIDGLEVCRRLREAEATAATPLIMLTARSEEADIVVGLELGADDEVDHRELRRVVVQRHLEGPRIHACRSCPAAQSPQLQLGKLLPQSFCRVDFVSQDESNDR